MSYFEFLAKPLIIINWDRYAEQQQPDDIDNYDDIINDAINQITNLIMNNNMNLRIEDNEIVPTSSNDSINDYINDIKTIIHFLNSKNIPWHGNIVAFVRDEKPGFLAVRNVDQGFADPVAIVAYVNDNLDLTKQYYPLINQTKLG